MRSEAEEVVASLQPLDSELVKEVEAHTFGEGFWAVSLRSLGEVTQVATKVGIDGIESMVSIYFSMIFRFEKCHRYIKHVSNFEPKNFDTQSESSLKHRYQKASIDFEIFFVYTSSESSQFYRYQRACIVFEAQIFDTLP